MTEQSAPVTIVPTLNGPYEVTGEGPDHARVFEATVIIGEVVATGSGSSRRTAEIDAAGKALTVLLQRKDA
jgi:ribonuclease-3